MALLLQPGDPVPALHLVSGRLDVNAHAGRFCAIVTGPRAALADLPSPDLPLLTTHDVTAARRLGADLVHGEPQPLVVLLDPAGIVVQSWADAPLPELLERARQCASELGARRQP